MMNIENKKKAIYYKVTKKQAFLWIIFLLSFVYFYLKLWQMVYCLDFPFLHLRTFLDFNYTTKNTLL